MFIELEYLEIVFLRVVSWFLVLKMWISFFKVILIRFVNWIIEYKMVIMLYEFDIKFIWMKKKNICMIFKWENFIWF